jgi:hypothetical protein
MMVLDYEEMKRKREQEIRDVCKRVFDIEPEEFYFYEGFLYATKWFGERRSGYPSVKMTVGEADECKFQDWMFWVYYDDEVLIYGFEKYKIISNKIYKLEVVIYTQ